MWPDRVLNPGPLTFESDAISTALRGPEPKVLTGADIHSEMGVSCPAHINNINRLFWCMY